MSMKSGPGVKQEIDLLEGFFRKSMVLFPIVVLFLLWATPPTKFFRLPFQSNDVDCRESHVDDLMKLWKESCSLNGTSLSTSKSFPVAPHLENCQQQALEWMEFDNRDANGRPPLWSREDEELELELMIKNSTKRSIKNLYPPWIKGGDEDNLPLTRAVQRDLWRHQHPKNCTDPSVKFLVTNWLNSRGLGLGAELVAMAGILAIALREKRVLVLTDFDRAKHEDCKGAAHGRWSCYFVPETSEECRARAMELEGDVKAWNQGTIVGLDNFSRTSVWTGPVPEYWGRPWETMQTFDVVDGELLTTHKGMDRQWWRAQAVRYYMRFSSEYTCILLNGARHKAFGKEAAQAVIQSSQKNWRKRDVMKLLWAKHRPWIPRPLISLHVRQGDKAAEMKIFDLKSHMALAEMIRARFPDIKGIWLSTEMQSVVDEAVSNFTYWSFYFTKVARQNGTTRMGDYERSLGTRLSSNNAFVNLLMAVDCDHFVGGLGSTWSFLIDGLRLTGGKLKVGFFSVNKDRYW
ncbi:uncharacterized protein LOC112345015 isoform X2 [Selaginella moellendorffii]|uniref:uncharacterized protein LOC112345015 isoform X2 n=1 Tax=Selaginella moellendorffii TaxID=88036 RepID=UPI000D1C8B39|nr:uncharacterized protein LOC112345015 isoform X2 [Selaginella moellendorffii]|eukprot:XP_024526633.1 uncharacterized protein LOC112345015 isoform X2 [Selaginella moellendorffii]